MKKLMLMIFMLLSSVAWANVPSNSPLKNVYSCNSSTTRFPYAFPISATSDMQVYISDSNGNTVQQSSSTYSVDTTNIWVNYPLSGSPCATGNTLTLLPSTPQTQITTYSSRTPFTATAVGASFDKLTMISQQLQEQINRTILAPIDSLSQTNFPSAQNGYVIGWQNGNLTNFLPNTNAYITTSTDGTFSANSDSLIPTQKATKTYVDTGVATKAAKGANSDITSLTALSTPLSIGQGGTGSSSNANAANGIIILNGSGQIPAMDGSLLTSVNATKVSNMPYVKLTNTQNSGAGGGSTSSGSWQTATINTKDSDTASIASLSTNVITLPAGTYQVSSSMPLYYSGSGNQAQTRLYNSTASAVLLNGTSVGNSGSVTVLTSFINGQFTLGSSSAVILQYYSVPSQSTSGQGIPVGAGSEVYAQIEFWKIQ